MRRTSSSYGAVFFRLLLGHAPLAIAFIDGLLHGAMKGMRASEPRPRRR